MSLGFFSWTKKPNDPIANPRTVFHPDPSVVLHFRFQMPVGLDYPEWLFGDGSTKSFPLGSCLSLEGSPLTRLDSHGGVWRRVKQTVRTGLSGLLYPVRFYFDRDVQYKAPDMDVRTFLKQLIPQLPFVNMILLHCSISSSGFSSCTGHNRSSVHCGALYIQVLLCFSHHPQWKYHSALITLPSEPGVPDLSFLQEALYVKLY